MRNEIIEDDKYGHTKRERAQIQEAQDEQKEAYLCLRAQGMKSIDALQEVEMSLQRQGE